MSRVLRQLRVRPTWVFAIATVFLAGTFGFGRASGAGEVIHACRNTATGAVRVVDAGQECKANEVQLSWNQQGPEGPQGPVGPAGAQGEPGPTIPSTRWFVDADRDAHGDWYRFIDSAVKPGDGYVTNASDCDDGDPSIHDGRVGDDSGEDSNCDGIGTFPPVEGPAVCLPGTDWDCDGVNGTKFGGTDCDDQDARVFPGNAETRYDGRDNDCDFQSADTGYDRPYQPDRFVALHIDPSHGPIQG